MYCGITNREGGESSIELSVPLKTPLAKARDSIFPGVKGSYAKSKGLEKAGVSTDEILLLVISRLI